MSILIKGMEMPKSCEECPLGDSLHCQVLPSVPALWAEYTNAIRGKRLHSECPLVPVPPHGRLVDADKLGFAMMDAANVDQALAMVDDAPTVIPADPPKEEGK